MWYVVCVTNDVSLVLKATVAHKHRQTRLLPLSPALRQQMTWLHLSVTAGSESAARPTLCLWYRHSRRCFSCLHSDFLPLILRENVNYIITPEVPSFQIHLKLWWAWAEMICIYEVSSSCTSHIHICTHTLSAYWVIIHRMTNIVCEKMSFTADLWHWPSPESLNYIQAVSCKSGVNCIELYVTQLYYLIKVEVT